MLVGTKIQPWGVWRVDPGFLYVMQDRERYKIGRTTKVGDRMKAGKTWLPDMKLIGCKPFWNAAILERDLHVGFAIGWQGGEWFQFEDPTIRDLLLDGFTAFSNTDRDRNSVDFIYWMNGAGMGEMVMDRSQQRLSRRRYLEQNSRARGR